MMVYREKMERKQVSLPLGGRRERVLRHDRIHRSRDRHGEGAEEQRVAELAEMFCKNVVEWSKSASTSWSNDDDAKVAVTKQVMGDAYTWMETMPGCHRV